MGWEHRAPRTSTQCNVVCGQVASALDWNTNPALRAQAKNVLFAHAQPCIYRLNDLPCRLRARDSETEGPVAEDRLILGYVRLSSAECPWSVD